MKLLLAVLGVALLFVPSVFRGGSWATHSPQKPHLTIQVDVDMVTLHVAVTTEDGLPFFSLSRDDFRVWEDKVEQQIIAFDMETAPASVGIILDVSDSMKRGLEAMRDAAATFVKDGTQNDEYFVIEFSNRPRLAQPFTTDTSMLSRSIDSATAHGMTALYDALYLGMEHVKFGQHGKKALLLITDGDDNRSRYSKKELDEVLKESNVAIYPIGMLADASTDEFEQERDQLQKLADLSGGDAFFPDSHRELDDICSKVAMELKNQYVIGYKPTNVSKDGRWRRIRVQVKRPPGVSHLTVRSRSGYYAPTG